MAQSYTGLNPINRNDLVGLIQLAIRSDRPLCIWGAPGIAKSATVQAETKKLGYGMVDYRVGNVPPEDLGGIMWPNDETKRVDRYMADIIAACWVEYERLQAEGNKEPTVVLFLDEINHATMAVQGPLYSIVLDRKSGGSSLPPRTRVLAAGNPDGTGSISEGMSAALIDRFWNVEYAGPTAEEYDEHAAETGGHALVRAFLRDNPTDINTFDPDAFVSATPRSWSDLSKVLHHTTRLTEMSAAADGHLGVELGRRFAAYVDMFGQIPTFDQISTDPEGAKVPAGVTRQYMTCFNIIHNLVNFWSYTHPEIGLIATSTTPEGAAIRNTFHTTVMRYVVRLGAEAKATFIADVMKVGPQLEKITGLSSLRVAGTTLTTQMLSDYRTSGGDSTEGEYRGLLSIVKDMSEATKNI